MLAGVQLALLNNMLLSSHSHGQRTGCSICASSVEHLLYDIAVDASPVCKVGTHPVGPCTQASDGTSDVAKEAQLLEMIRNGSHPLDTYGITSDIPKVSIVLAKVLQQCQVFFGSYRTVNTNK